ncbi:Uu.00g120710.m01.CDS01 [Anthostomella pinea]|uniref:laccase n=1 Tax=Anthostomella pinea TaxID=933095 RepID=A0AAI8VGW8_9PEZI|nr:Uu.00g120710.m01.CDS01 [Anthostomella pinea]
MRFPTSLTGIMTGIFFWGLATAAPSGLQTLEPRAAGSCHSATSRACWSSGYTVQTDYEQSTPPGGIKTFNWEITEHDNWQGPDGRVKSKVMLVNNQYPGPTLTADWGDTIKVTIKNSLRINGTSIHWHGFRQFGTNIQDGVNGITECPIPPGGSKTYTLKATQYGTSWYHSHFSAQYGNGVVGSIVINGPASSNYDIDLGAYPISDYYLRTADQIVGDTMVSPAPPASDNVLFNGKNINPVGSGGEYSKLTFTPGKRHRLRFINPSVEHNYQVSIVGHNMTVISTDFVPVNSFSTDNVFLGVGQRVDVTIDASRTIGNYWMNVTMYANNFCGSSVNTFPAAIVQYAGAPNTNPTDKGTLPANTNCRDSLDYVPVVTRQAPLDTFTPNASDTLDITLETSALVSWKVNNSSMVVQWDKPIIQYVMDGNTSYPTSENVVVVSQPNQWTFWVVENESPIPHPLHLHGHDFMVLGASAANAGAFTAADKTQLKANNPVRRDVTMLPPSGWVILAFKADNPGNWLFHCHIAWHVAGGLSVDFLERVPEQKALIRQADSTAFNSNCAAWRKYYATSPEKQMDSGLKMREITI